MGNWKQIDEGVWIKELTWFEKFIEPILLIWRLVFNKNNKVAKFRVIMKDGSVREIN